MYDPDADDELAALDTEPPPDAPVPGPADRLVPVFGAEPWIMGILNVTPDSFSDGGRWDRTETAVARGLQLAGQGAHLVDVGGESTRPGAHRVDQAEEIDRVVPVIAELASAGVLCSVDTTRSAVAAAAVAAGAVIVNDVSGGLADPGMADVVAGLRCPWILMHWRGPSTEMDRLAHYHDVAGEIVGELAARVEAALAAGIDERSLILDPGLGFAKTAAHNWEVLARLADLVGLGLPVLVGASRKRFLGQLLAAPDPDGDPELDLARPAFDPGGLMRPAAGREFATAAVSASAAHDGVWGVRVHEPGPTADVFAVDRALAGVRGQERPGASSPLESVSILAESDYQAAGRSVPRTGRWLPPPGAQASPEQTALGAQASPEQTALGAQAVAPGDRSAPPRQQEPTVTFDCRTFEMNLPPEVRRAWEERHGRG